jgi:antitoxin ParD1/3/4
MPTRKVMLTEHHAKRVERLVDSGRYRNASAVMGEGLRLLEERDAKEKAGLKSLRNAARVGIADIKQGRYTTHPVSADIGRRVSEILESVCKTRANQQRRGEPARDAPDGFKVPRREFNGTPSAAARLGT